MTANLARQLRRADHAVYRKVALTNFPAPVDRCFRDISSAASYSVLWGSAAAAMGLSGRMSLRRAGTRGLIAIGIASPLVNLAVKQLAGRSRPVNQVVPLSRRAVMPTSPSFPSGHAASAAGSPPGSRSKHRCRWRSRWPRSRAWSRFHGCTWASITRRTCWRVPPSASARGWRPERCG